MSARDVHIVKELEDVDTMERQPVNFLCEVNQVDVDGRWYRDDCRIRPGDNITIRHQGKLYSIFMCLDNNNISYRFLLVLPTTSVQCFVSTLLSYDCR